MKILSALLTALLVSSAALAQTTGPSTGTAPQHVICDSGCGSPPASADGTAFTAGVTNVSLIGAAFNDALAALTAGKYAAPRITAYRALHINIRDAAGAEFGNYLNPFSIQDAFGGHPLTDVELRATPPTVAITSAAPIEVAGIGGAGNSVAVYVADAGNAVVGKVKLINDTGDIVGVTSNRLNVNCASGCSAGTPGQATMANSSPVVIASDQTAVPVSGTVTVTDGAGALNTIVDSGTLTAVTTITNPVTVTDGAGALNVIVDSGTTTVTQATGTNLHAVIDSGAVTVSDGAGALNVIVDSGTLTTVSTVTAVTGITNALPAGSNIIGNVRIDQTTPGTTNAVQANAGTNLNTSLLALETTQVTGNASLASIKTNTDPLVAAGAGGYVRQDSTATIAKETGGNLATIAALSKAEDATHNSGDPGVQFLTVRNESATVLTSADGDYGPVATDSHGHTFARVVGQQNGTENVAIVSPLGAQIVTFMQPAALPLFPCNAVRRMNCQR